MVVKRIMTLKEFMLSEADASAGNMAMDLISYFFRKMKVKNAGRSLQKALTDQVDVWADLKAEDDEKKKEVLKDKQDTLKELESKARARITDASSGLEFMGGALKSFASSITYAAEMASLQYKEKKLTAMKAEMDAKVFNNELARIREGVSELKDSISDAQKKVEELEKEHEKDAEEAKTKALEQAKKEGIEESLD